MKNKLYLIAGIICYLAAIAFFVSAIIGKSTVFLTVGVLWICIGNLDILLSRKRNGNKMNTSWASAIVKLGNHEAFIAIFIYMLGLMGGLSVFGGTTSAAGRKGALC